MRTKGIQELSLERFSAYGAFAQLIDPQAPKIGAIPIEFFRDMALLDLGGARQAAFSTCRVTKRLAVIDVSEYHTSCGEAILPLDGDVLIHVGPATAGNEVPVDDIEIFRVPKGAVVTLRPGVWHHAPFALQNDAANVLIVLPERTYANDCKVVPHAKRDRIQIEGA